MSAEYGESRYSTLFYIRGEGCGDTEPEAIEASVHDELSRIAAEGVSDHELERAKHLAQGTHKRQFAIPIPWQSNPGNRR